LITLLILEKNNSNYSTILQRNTSISFLPTSVNNNLISISYSWINSYFSKDKIFVVCTPDEEESIKSSCKGINEENIIIEPKRINYSVSVFYATLVIGKIYPNEVIFFVPVNFLFEQDAKIGNWLFAIDEMAKKEWIIIPSILLNNNNNEKEYVDAGKSVSNLKGFDFFKVESIIKISELDKKKKYFGKNGKLLKIICGKQNLILKSYLENKSANYFFKILYNDFKSDDLSWDKILLEYENIEIDIFDYDYFQSRSNFLTIFLDTKPFYLDNWESFLGRFSNFNNNVISGNVKEQNCKSVVCLNYDEEEITIDSVENLIINKKNGEVAIKSILNKEVCDAVSKKEKKS